MAAPSPYLRSLVAQLVARVDVTQSPSWFLYHKFWRDPLAVAISSGIDGSVLDEDWCRQCLELAAAVRAEDPRLEAFVLQGKTVDEACALLAKIDRRPS